MDPSQILTWKDGIYIGVAIGIAIANYGRRHMGERLGTVEKLIAAELGLDLDSKQRLPAKRRERNE